ncbi:MAG: sulfotransferase [Thiotrichaceae bacterium]
MSKFRYCFTFICQQGDLEIKALLLAASLKQFLRCDYELIAALPQPTTRWGAPSEQTLELLAQWGVQTVEITNQINDDYPIGNKVSCAAIPTTADKLIFLDSDIICMREFQHQTRFAKDAFHAKPADVATYTGNLQQWQTLYQLFQKDIPELRVSATVSGEIMPPYFNAGFLAIPPSQHFFNTWLACCRRIDESPKIVSKRPYLDQIALSVAVMELGFSLDCLDESYNYPAHHKPLDINNLPFFCHYHHPLIIRREPALYRLVTQLLQKYPELAPMLRQSPEWAKLTVPHFQPRQTWWGKTQTTLQLPEAIITGIPRSGTSYLCKILHQVKESVVINEPQEIFNYLHYGQQPWQFANFYRDLRRNIIEGVPIENKIREGEVVEDTRIHDVRVAYSPLVTRDDFLLTTKNTLAYMARIPQIKRVLPEALIIALIRHPLDVIASWKKSFSHLEQAMVTTFPVGYPNDSMLNSWQRQQLQEIAHTESALLRRALLWRYLAMCLLEYQAWLHLVKYEELVMQPCEHVEKILQQLPNAPPLLWIQSPQASQIRQQRDVLDSQEKQVINAVCGQIAQQFGYVIE